MTKGTLFILTLFIQFTLGSLLSQNNLSFVDEKVEVVSEVKTLSDKQNDRFYDYYQFSVENISEQIVHFIVVYTYEIDGQEKKSELSEEVTLSPGESIIGDRDLRRDLTLFKSFNPGNSGKKLSEKNVKLVSFKINYL